MVKFIYVTLQKEFIHQYKDAPDEVSYLRYPHRHVAHIKVEVQVFNNDREIEFIMFKHWLENMITIDQLTNNSCETIAENIMDMVQKEYGMERDRIVRVTVSEDGENGCMITGGGKMTIEGGSNA